MQKPAIFLKNRLVEVGRHARIRRIQLNAGCCSTGGQSAGVGKSLGLANSQTQKTACASRRRPRSAACVIRRRFGTPADSAESSRPAHLDQILRTPKTFAINKKDFDGLQMI